MTFNFIKRNISFCIYICLGLYIVGCETKNEQTNEKDIAKDSTITPLKPVPITTQNALFRTIIGEPIGDFRGLNFGDPISKIKATETFELFEDSTTHVAYTYETDNFETIDVIYYLNKDKLLQGVKIESYLNDANAAKIMWDQFDTYFSGKYPTEKREKKAVYWHSDKGKKIILEDVSQGKDFGITVLIGDKPAKTP